MSLNRIIFIFGAALLLWHCSDSTTPPPADIDYGNIGTISYDAHVQPLLNEYATLLTDNGILPPGLQMDSWDNLIKGWERGEAIIAYDADNSLLVELTTKLDNANELSAEKIAFLERWINEGAKNATGQVPYAGSTNVLYVCSQGAATINVIDVDARLVIRNIDLTDAQYGYPASSKPHHIAVSPDKSAFFVSMIDPSVNTVVKLDAATYQKLGEVTTNIPALLDHHPTEDILYVSRFMLMNSTTSIYAINSQTMQPAPTGNNGEIILPPGLTVPHCMGLSVSGDYAYTASFAEDEFLVVDNSNKSFLAALPLGDGKQPLQGTISNDDNTFYLSCIGSGQILHMDVSNPAAPVVADSTTVGGAPWHSVSSLDGSKLYVGNLMMQNLAIIDLAGNTVETVGAGDGSDGLAQPHGIAISDDGASVFVSGRNTNGAYSPYYQFGDNDITGVVTVINTATNQIEKIIEIENFGSGMRMRNE